MESKEAQTNEAYFLPVSCGRTFPVEKLTPKKLFQARFNDNTTPLALTLNTLFPAMTLINQELDQRIRKGEEIPMNDLHCIVCNSTSVSLRSFGGLVMRVSSQTAIASALTIPDSPKLNSIVYLWDAQPRFNYYYLSKLMKWMNLPSFFASLTGKPPRKEDLIFLSSTPSLGAVVEDSIKRKVIFTGGDLAAACIQSLYNTVFGKSKKDGRVIKHRSINLFYAFLCSVIGSAVGFSVGGGSGEIIGELLSFGFCPYLTTITFNALEGKS